MRHLILFMSFILLLYPATVVADAAVSSKGLAIAREADRRDAGFQDYTNNLLMILRNKQGQESTREMRVRTLEVDGDGDKSLSLFLSPKDIKGTAFLNYTHKLKDDDQWLYLPALKRVKRINSRNKSGSFMGSEFAYEDISSQEVEKYTYKWMKDEEYNNLQCFVIERYPVDKKNTGYTRQIVWLDKTEYRIQKIEYYDRKQFLLKTLTALGYQKFLDKFWRAKKMNMVNHQTGKSTELIWSNYKFRVGLTDRDFYKNSLLRAR